MSDLLKWPQLTETWSTANYLWSDVRILIQAAGGGGIQMFNLPPHTYLPPAEIVKKRLPAKEYKRFVELACLVNGISTKDIKQRKSKGEIEVTIGEIERLYESFSRSITIKRIYQEDI